MSKDIAATVDKKSPTGVAVTNSHLHSHSHVALPHRGQIHCYNLL